MTAKRDTLTNQLRRAVNRAGATNAQIAKGAGMDRSLLSNFLAGRKGLSVASLDALGEVLRLRLVAEGPARVPPPARMGRPPKRQARKGTGRKG